MSEREDGVVIAALCVGSEGVPSQEDGGEGGVLHRRVQSARLWSRVRLYLPRQRSGYPQISQQNHVHILSIFLVRKVVFIFYLYTF